MIITVGIDPGKTGAACFLKDGVYMTHVDFTSGPVVSDFFKDFLLFYHVDLAVLEKVNAMPPGRSLGPDGKIHVRRSGATSTFTFGENFGYWQGLLDYSGIPWILARPQEWQKGLIPKKQNVNDKPGLVVAKRLFPEAPLYLKKHHNRADALLIARYAYELKRKG